MMITHSQSNHMKKHHPYKKNHYGFLTILLLVSICLPPASAISQTDKKPLVVYTNRKEDLLKPLLTQYAKQHHIKLQVYYGGNSLIERIKQESINSPADIVITQNVAMVEQLKKSGLTNPLPLSITSSIPKNFIERRRQWAGVSYRARIIVVRKNSPAENIANMQQLADKKWHNSVCLRDGFHPYNLGLFSALRVYMNNAKMKKYLIHLKNNLVQKPGGSDRDQIKLVYNGRCQIAIANSYYYGLLKKEIPDLASKTTPLLVSLTSRTLGDGVATNLSAVAVMKNAKHKKTAEHLVGFLLSDTAQTYFMVKNNEYPVMPSIAWGDNLLSLDGKKFRSDYRAMVRSYKYYPFIIKTLLAINFNQN
ncbi:MAG: extracellular solute-binding protein [Alphaproteobacteria bacterium]